MQEGAAVYGSPPAVITGAEMFAQIGGDGVIMVVGSVACHLSGSNP